MVAQLLTTRDVRVDTARSFAEAIALKRHYHVGVFDLELGDGSGAELARRLLRARQVEHVVFFTGGAAPMELARAVQLGRVFDKGLGPGPLVDWVERWLHASRDSQVG